MNQIQKLFERKKDGILSVFFIAGYPALEDTGKIIRALSDNVADLIEIGMPYSDPVADGPVIEQAASDALRNGMTIQKLFEQLKNYREDKKTPLILMGYLNPVMQYGFEAFCKEALSAGISGLIIPDLPPEIYQQEYQKYVEESGLKMIFLITPETEDSRIRMIDSISSGFIYAVSSSSVTGRDTDENKKEKYFQHLHEMKLRNPVLVGFGIKDKKTFDQACRYANGAITGTAFIKRLKDDQPLQEITSRFIRSMYNEN